MTKNYWYILVTYLVMQLSGIIGIPIIMFFGISQTPAVVAWSLFSFIAALLITLYLLKDEIKLFGQRGNKEIGTIVLWSILGVVLVYVTQILAILIETFVLGIKPGSQNTMEIMNVARVAPIFVIVIAIVGPVLEEIIFRKIIFGSIYKKTNFIIAGLASALIFGLVHADNPHILVYTSIGLVFAFLYVQTKRIIVPIIAHIAMNTYAVVGQLSLDPEEIQRIMEEFEKLQMIFIGG